MAITKEEVRAALEPDEPDYREAADRFGEEALPYLEELLDDPRPDIPAKAASLAGMIDGPEAASVLEKAAESPDPVVRVAAAGAAAELSPEVAERVLVRLVRDGDVGVQKTALKAVPSEPTDRLRDAIRDLTLQDPFLSDLRDRALGRAPPGGERGQDSESQEETPRIGPMPGEERSGGPDPRATPMDADGGASPGAPEIGSMPEAEPRTREDEMPTGAMPQTGGDSEMPGGAMD